MANLNKISDARPRQLPLPFMNAPSFMQSAGSFRRHESVEESVRLSLSNCALSRARCRAKK